MSDSSSRSLLTLFRPSTAQPSAAAGGKPEIVLIQHTLKLFDKRIAAAIWASRTYTAASNPVPDSAYSKVHP